MISTKLETYLNEAGVPHTHNPHSVAYTALEVAQSAHIPGHELLKSVILKADKDLLVMGVLSADEIANLDLLKKEIGCRTLGLATESEFRDYFPTCDAGAMPPFGNIFGVPVYCDASLGQNEQIEFNAGAHDETIRMAFADYKRLVKPKMVQFAEPYRTDAQHSAS